MKHQKPSFVPGYFEEELQRTCRKCGRGFTTRCRVKRRCDRCQTAIDIERYGKPRKRILAGL